MHYSIIQFKAVIIFKNIVCSWYLAANGFFAYFLAVISLYRINWARYFIESSKICQWECLCATVPFYIVKQVGSSLLFWRNNNYCLNTNPCFFYSSQDTLHRIVDYNYKNLQINTCKLSKSKSPGNP